MASGVPNGDEPPEGQPEHHGILDLEGVAEPHHVVGPGVEVPPRRVATPVAPPLAPVVDVHDLVGVGEAVEVRAEGGVVRAWTAVEEHQGGLWHHRLGGRVEARADDVDEQPRPLTDVHAHPVTLRVVAPTRRR